MLLALAFLGVLLAPAAEALAHPLGNFTVNRYSRIEVTSERISVRYVLDLAEIPTFQAMPVLDANRDGAVDDAEKRVYAGDRLREVSRNLSLTVNKASRPLQVQSSELELIPGEGGLETMRLSGWLATSSLSIGAAGTRTRLEYRDDNEPERTGWREIVLRTGEGISIESGTVSMVETSNELRNYPKDSLRAGLDQRMAEATLVFGGAGIVSPIAVDAVPTGSANVSALTLFGQSFSLAEIVGAGKANTATVAFALLLAAVWGACSRPLTGTRQDHRRRLSRGYARHG